MVTAMKTTLSRLKLNRKGAVILALVVALLIAFPAFAWAEPVIGSSPGMFDFGKQLTKWIVESALEPFAQTILGVASEFYSILSKGQIIGGDLSSFPEVERVVNTILDRVLVPFAQGFFGIFLAIDCLRIVRDTGSSSLKFAGLGVMEQWIIFAIKYSILYVVITHVKLIMYSVFSIFHAISNAIQNNILVNMPTNTISSDMMNASFEAITYDQGIGLGLVLVLVALVVLICVALTTIYTQVLAIVRIFEIFIGIAFAPIPLTMLAVKELSQGAISFIRWFCGACLQLAILYAIVALGGPLISSISSSLTAMFTSTNTGVEAIMIAIVPIVSSLALFMMVKQSRDISNRIVGM